MNFNIKSLLKVLFLSFVFIIQFSCSKDSDLLTDYALAEDLESISIDDVFVVSVNGSTVLDVLANDDLGEQDNVTITDVSQPDNGNATLNEDNTITYTPETTEETVDTFTYTTEVVNENETATTQTGNVTITVTNENRAPTSGDNVYYVTTSGKSNNDGKTEATAWNIQHAFRTAKAGDIVYVKAGNYGATYIATTRGGSPGNPIVFIGYSATPGDITATTGPTYTKDNWVSDGQNLPDNVMPHLEATAINEIPKDSEVAFTINHDYMELHNFMISRHYSGIKINADNIVLDNIIGYRFGNWSSSSNCWNLGSAFSCDNATGYGIYSALGSSTSDWTVKNSIIIDAGMAAYFPVDATNVLIENCKGYAYNAGNGSDYIFDLYNTTNSIVRNCYAERTYTLPLSAHRSRSLILQAGSDNNLVQDFSSYNLRLQLENARNNTLENLHLVGNNTTINSGGIQVYGQSDDNLFKNVYMSGEGIQFLGIDAIENQRFPHTSSGDNNYFINVIIENVSNTIGNAVVSFHRLNNYDTTDPYTSGTNYIIGGTFNNIGRIINANRPGTIHFYNCAFSNINLEEDSYYANWPNYSNNYRAYYTNCNFYNMNGFSVPTAGGAVLKNQTTGNPMLANPANGDFTILGGSNLINKGMDGSTIHVDANKDFLGNPRGVDGTYDIGAYEN